MSTPTDRHERTAGRSRRRLESDTIRVDGRTAAYAGGGRGLPVLFLHGWGLDHRAYRRSLTGLIDRGCRVIAPSMPGFGGSTAMPIGSQSLMSYAEWVGSFLDALDVDEPLVVVGHSFGGGVATKFAHDHPDRVRYLVLMNSVGATRPFGGTFADHIGTLGFLGPLATAWSPTAEGAAERMVHRVLAENFIRDPLAVVAAGRLALTADLAEEIEELAAREVPVLVLWSDRDSVIPLSAFDTFCSTFGADSEMVAGGHSWLLANPDAFGQVLDNVLHVQNEEHRVQTAATQIAQTREHLKPTTVPKSSVLALLDAVSPLWALSAPPQVLAADLTLCHPALEPDEVRAVARPVGPAAHRLTIVGHDRAGLLADTTSLLANQGLRVESASVMTWSKEDIALHSLVVHTDAGLGEPRWEDIGEQLRTLGRTIEVSTPFAPAGRARVTRTGAGLGTSVVRVSAPDQLGLLSAICRWFADNDVALEAAQVATHAGQAEDVFLIRGECDTDELADRLSKAVPCSIFDLPTRMTQEFVRAAMRLG